LSTIYAEKVIEKLTVKNLKKSKGRLLALLP
jgi:hypothetical protein